MKHKTGKTLALLLALALLVGLLPGMGITAYALELSEGFDTTTDKAYTGEHFTITSVKENDGEGIYCRALSPVRIEATNGDMITRVDLTIGYYGGYGRAQYLTSDHGTLSYITEENGDVISFVNVNSPSIEISSSVFNYLQFSSVVVYYAVATVTWMNWDGTVLETDVNVPYGITPTYDGATPTKTGTAEFSYSFNGWSPEVTAVTGDATYTATYAGSTNGYTVTWVNDDGTVLETDANVPYGATPTYDGATPTKASTTENTYAFAGWSPTIASVTGNATYTATYTTISNMRTVTWMNWDGTVLKTDLAALGTMPAYTGATPTRPDDASYHYTFAGWSPELAVVTDNVTYTAVFSATPIQVQPTTYTVSFFANGGGGVMNPVTVPANTIYTLPACGFTPPAGKLFKAWQLGSTEFAPGDTIKVDSNAEFVALWKDDDGSGESGHGGITGDIVFIGGGYGGADEWYDGGYALQRAWKIKLAPMVNGSAALGIMTGESTTTEMNVYPTTTIYVFPNENPGFVLDKIIWSYIDGTASYDITEAKNFVMPAMDVVVYVTFKPVG